MSGPSELSFGLWMFRKCEKHLHRKGGTYDLTATKRVFREISISSNIVPSGVFAFVVWGLGSEGCDAARARRDAR